VYKSNLKSVFQNLVISQNSKMSVRFIFPRRP